MKEENYKSCHFPSIDAFSFFLPIINAKMICTVRNVFLVTASMKIRLPVSVSHQNASHCDRARALIIKPITRFYLYYNRVLYREEMLPGKILLI